MFKSILEALMQAYDFLHKFLQTKIFPIVWPILITVINKRKENMPALLNATQSRGNVYIW